MRNARRVVFVLTIAVSLVGAGNQYVKPSDRFLDSILVVRAGILDFGELRVGDFVDHLDRLDLDNGTTPQILGWTREDNEYTLHFRMKKEAMQLTFTHDLSVESDGKFSLAHTISSASESGPAARDVFFILSLPTRSADAGQ